MITDRLYPGSPPDGLNGNPADSYIRHNSSLAPHWKAQELLPIALYYLAVTFFLYFWINHLFITHDPFWNFIAPELLFCITSSLFISVFDLKSILYVVIFYIESSAPVDSIAKDTKEKNCE